MGQSADPSFGTRSSDATRSNGEGNPERRLRCLALVDSLPGGQYQTIRKPLGGVRGWFARSEEKLLRRLRPELQMSSLVRGNRIAVDALFEALLQYSERLTFSFAVPDQDKSQFEEWAAANPQTISGQPVNIYGRAELSRTGLDAEPTEGLLNLYGRSDVLPRMRNRGSSRVLPTVSVMHGLSNHNHVYEHHLRTLLTPHYASDSIVCTSYASKAALEAIFARIASAAYEQFGARVDFGGRVDVIPLCVDPQHQTAGSRQNARKELGLLNDATVLLYFGYLSGVKADLSPLLPVIQRLAVERPHSKLMFVIAGTGPDLYYAALLRLVNELGLARNVMFFREVSDLLKVKLFQAADIFVAPCDSLQESFGLTPVEAMSFGVPQVVADWNGYRDTVVEGKTGFRVPTLWGPCDGDLRDTGDAYGWAFDHIVQGQSISFDITIMYERLKALIDNPELRQTMSDNSRERAASEYSPMRVARLYDDLFVELSTVASNQPSRASVRALDEPTYYECFKHDATKVITDDCLIGGSTYVGLHISDALRIVQAMIPDVPILEEALLTRIAETVSLSGSRDVSVCVADLVSAVANVKWSREIVMRHILFLIKHGILCALETVEPCEER